MDSLYLFQFACLNFMVINALVIGITHYYARWRNRRYEQSRWMLFAAFTVLAVQYFVLQPSSPSTASTTISATVCLWADGSTS